MKLILKRFSFSRIIITIILLTFGIIFFSPFHTEALLSFPDKIDTLQERKNIQTVLNTVMVPSPNLTVDGVLGRKTIQTIQAFQASQGLEADGKIGPMTRSALVSAQGGSTTYTTTTQSSTPGCSSGAVFNTLTGQRCTSTPTVTTTSSIPGCTTGALFSTINGQRCTGTTTTLPAGCTGSNKFSTISGASCTSTTTTTTTVKKGGGGGGGGGSSSPTVATCSGATTASCTISNGTGSQSRTCTAGNWSGYGTCTVTACNSGYQISGNTCTSTSCSGSTTQSCTISNGTGSQSRTCSNGSWSSFNTCAVSACNNGYTQNGNSCVAVVVPPQTSSTGLAFPNAVGFSTTRGAYASNVQPKILIVDNLNWTTTGDEATGRGSLRWALERNYPRIILFEVSGTIDGVRSELNLRNPYVTIAGQTAPSPGITLKGVTFIIRTHDVVLQHMRLRLGPQNVGWDGITIVSDVNYLVGDIIIDHNSITWGMDENIGIWSNNINYVAYNTTLSNNLIAEELNLYQSGLPGRTNGHDSRCLLVGSAENTAVINNIFANCGDRTPLVNHYTRSIFIANNLMHHIIVNRLSFGTEVPLDAVVVGNVHKKVDTSLRDYMIYMRAEQHLDSRIYLEDNEDLSRTEDPWSIILDYLHNNVVRSQTPTIWPTGFTAKPSQDVEQYLLSNSGARPADRDSVDSRIINDIVTNTGRIVIQPDDVGGYPTLAQNTRSLSSVAGYPSSNPHGDDDSDGYTNIEEWIHEQSRIVEGR